MAKTKLPGFLFKVNVVILLSMILLSLGLSTYKYGIREGITANDVRAAAAAKNSSMLAIAKPTSMVLPKKFDVLIIDSATYTDAQIQSRSTFAIKNANSGYLISSTSEETPNQNTTPQAFSLGQTTTVTIPIETSKFNDYMVIAPNSNSTFPPNFTLTITNRQSDNGMQTWLWGSTPSRESVPTNNIIGSDNINKTPYLPGAFLADPTKGLTVAGLNIGNNAINIVGNNNIYDKNFVSIGTVSSSDNVITINCTNSKGITGIFIYLGFADKTA
jgi:hypothetical protein